ncbi:hypothetical protein A9Q77_01520 [Marinomonas sp. 42_23_T18]|nr:hypothetical protein A9Q77_01520 [Marinomonas sp. 42_23_T18]
MKKSDKPLFSKPVLAGLMIFISLMVLVLNLTAPPSKYPKALLESWQTSNQIPITWINQESWQGSNKLELRIRFSHGRKQDKKLGLTDALFALLMLDTLPLSTSPINQRLADVTTQLAYHVSNQESELAITLNSEARYLDASMAILIPWFNQPNFKNRSFQNWQQSHNPYYLSNKAQLEQALFPKNNSQPLDGVLDEYSLNLQDIKRHYQYLLSSIDQITIVGDLSDPSRVKGYLTQLTQNTTYSATLAKLAIANTNSLQTEVGAQLIQSHGAFAFDTITTAKDWISLQIWLPYYLSKLKKASAPSYVQLHLESSPQMQWAWWSIQHEQSVLQSADQLASNNTKQDKYFSKTILTQSINRLSEDSFDNALIRYQDKLANHVLSPSWWARMASQETLSGIGMSGLSLEQWNNNYADAVNDLSYSDFNASIARLVLSSSLQELQQRH